MVGMRDITFFVSCRSTWLFWLVVLGHRSGLVLVPDLAWPQLAGIIIKVEREVRGSADQSIKARIQARSIQHYAAHPTRACPYECMQLRIGEFAHRARPSCLWCPVLYRNCIIHLCMHSALRLL